MGDVVKIDFKPRPRIVGRETTALEDLEYALRLAWARASIARSRGTDDSPGDGEPPEGKA